MKRIISIFAMFVIASCGPEFAECGIGSECYNPCTTCTTPAPPAPVVDAGCITPKPQPPEDRTVCKEICKEYKKKCKKKVCVKKEKVCKKESEW